MIKAYITYSDKTTKIKLYTSLSSALQELNSILDIGDSYTVKEGETLLAKCTIIDYKGDFK